MKKFTKVLALFLTVIVLMSSFSIMSGAISAKSSAKELLDYYEDCIIKTSAKEDVVKVENNYKGRETADYSSLKGEDLETTKADNEEWGYYTGEWTEDNYSLYFYCDAYEDYYWEGRSEFVDYFSIKRDIRRMGLKFKSYKYSEAKNGDVTVTFVYTYTDEVVENYTSTWTYTVKINKSGYLKSYSVKKVSNNVEYSFEDNLYKVTHESIDTYTFVYNKVKVKSIELSENRVVLGRDEEYVITVEVGPENATYKDCYINWDATDIDVADCYGVDDDGTLTVHANGPGTTSFDVCAYGGDVVKTVEVVVEYSVIDYIAEFFANTLNEIRWFFMDLFYGFEEDVVVEEEIIYEEEI